MDKLGRRVVLRRGVQLLAAVLLLPLVAGRARAAKSCVDPSSESLRESLHYTDMTPDPAEPCKACGFFTGEANSNCGPCMIMSGPVHANGHCDSWSAKGS